MKLRNLLLLLPAILALSFVVQAQGPLNPYQVTQLRTKPTTQKADSMYVAVVSKNGSIAQKVLVADLPTYKVWSGLLTQTGTDAPTATVLQNTLGGTITWARTSAGLYTATLTGAFTADKTFSVGSAFNDGTAVPVIVAPVRTSANVVTVNVSAAGVLTDAKLTATSFEIRVYK